MPGCATGEEAYSIAICLMEFLDEAKLQPSVRDFRHRYQRNGHRKSPRRHIHGRRVGPCLAAAIGAVLHPIGTRVPDREEHPRRVRFCQAQPGAGPAFLQAGPHQLLQRADLPGSRIAAQGLVDPALRPQANGLPGARSIGKHRHAFRVVSSSGEDPQDLLHAAGREYAGAAAERRPPRRRPGGSPGENLPRAEPGWTC